MREFSNPPNPIIFEIHSVIYDKQKPPPPQLHCGVLQFTADAKTARIPYWMTYCLQHHNGERVKDGDRMKFKLVRGLEPAKYAKFRPLDKRFARDIQTPRASLEHALHKFTALTAGQRIPIIHDGRVYPVKVEEVRPSPAAHLIDTNLQVEFVEHDEMKAIDEQHDIRGLIQGHSSEVKTDAIDGDDDDDDYEHVELIAMYSSLHHTAKENKARYYKVKIGNPNFGVRIILKIKHGDANLYAHYEHDKPSIARYQWYDESPAMQKVIEIATSDAKFSNWFYIGVHSFGASACEYELVVDQDMTDSSTTTSTSAASTANMLGSSSSSSSSSASSEQQSIVPPNMQRCEHCGKLIASQSFMMHSMRCASVNWKCDICHAVLAKSMKASHIHCAQWQAFNCNLVFASLAAMQRHVQLRHTQIECNLCRCALYPNQIISHQEHECTFRKVACAFCGMRVKFVELASHEALCGALTVECELCGESVTRKWLQNHLASEHNINPTLQTNLVDTIISSNLGLDAASLQWHSHTSSNENANAVVTGLDEDEDANGSALNGNESGQILNELEDIDPVVKSIKRELSQSSVHSVGDVHGMQRTVTDPTIPPASKIDENAEDDEDLDLDDGGDGDGELHEFACPFCQKHPPKTQEFGEHLAICGEREMNDSD